MASTPEALCNIALSHLGNVGKVASLSSPSSQEEIFCARFYPIAQKIAFTEFDCKFAIRKARLNLHDADDSDGQLSGEWSFMYDQPESCIRVLKVLPSGAAKNRPSEDFSIATIDEDPDEAETPANVIVTNLDNAYADYIKLITDTTMYPEDFTLVFSYKLAALLAGPTVKGKSGIQLAQSMEAMYQMTKNSMVRADAQQEQISGNYKSHIPGWVGDR